MAHLDAGPIGLPGKCQTARRRSPSLSTTTVLCRGETSDVTPQITGEWLVAGVKERSFQPYSRAGRLQTSTTSFLERLYCLACDNVLSDICQSRTVKCVSIHALVMCPVLHFRRFRCHTTHLHCRWSPTDTWRAPIETCAIVTAAAVRARSNKTRTATTDDGWHARSRAVV